MHGQLASVASATAPPSLKQRPAHSRTHGHVQACPDTCMHACIGTHCRARAGSQGAACRRPAPRPPWPSLRRPDAAQTSIEMGQRCVLAGVHQARSRIVGVEICNSAAPHVAAPALPNGSGGDGHRAGGACAVQRLQSFSCLSCLRSSHTATPMM